ncbi:MAG: hypothetical protein J6J36_00475 [Clostridia bacterium]|nr:hypothetical protein [Clostridia bacterium]
MKQEIQTLKSRIETWKAMSRLKDYSKEIAEAEARIKELEQQIKEQSTNQTKVETSIVAKEINTIKVDVEIENDIEEEEDEEEYKYDKNEVWLVPMNTSFINCGKKDKNYMDFKALALFTYFSNRKGEEVCDMLGLDYSEVEEHRYLYRSFVNENIEKFEDLSGWKKRNIYTQINKLTKAGNKVFDVCYDSQGRTYYKIMPYVDKENKLSKSGTFVTIESDILKYLINTSNSNMIKIYCFLKWFLIDYKHYEKTGEIKYVEKPIDRKFMCEQIGLNGNSSKNKGIISEDIEKDLCAKHLIERKAVTVEEFGQIKTRYYYKLVPYHEWKSFYKKLGK